MNHFAKIIIIFTLFQLNIFSSNYTEVKIPVADFNVIEGNYFPNHKNQHSIYYKNTSNTTENSITKIHSNKLFVGQFNIFNQNNLYSVSIINFHDLNLDGNFDPDESLIPIQTYYISGFTNSGESYIIENDDVPFEFAPIVLLLPAGQYTVYSSPHELFPDDNSFSISEDNPKVISINGSQSSYNLEFGFNFAPSSVTLSDSSTSQSIIVTNVFSLLSVILLGILSLFGLIFLIIRKVNLN